MGLDDILTFANSATSMDTPPKKVVKSKKKSKVVDNMTLDFFTNAFDRGRKLKASDMLGLGKHKTIFGASLSIRDIVVSVAVINGDGATTNRFISISFKYVTKKESKKFIELYTMVRHNKRYATVVERKIMENVEYVKHKRVIQEQFL